MKKDAKKIYFDNAASTKLDNAALKAMLSFLTTQFANPSSLHTWGRGAKQALEEARLNIAKSLHANAKEIIFTSGGTESINLAIFGVAKQYQKNTGKPGHIISSKIEHEAVLECLKELQSNGWTISYLQVSKDGEVLQEKISKLVKPNTALVSIMYANNELGTINNLTKVGKIISGINRNRKLKKLAPILFHSDACQAGELLNLNIMDLKVDLLSLNGSKLHGPKGVGILYKKSGVELQPIIYGGGQELGLRSGTENVPSIIGFSKALDQAQKDKKKNAKKLFDLQTYLEHKLSKHFKNIKFNGPKNLKFITNELENFGFKKLPGTTNFYLSNYEGEALMYYLDAKGFAVSTGSACTSGSDNPSHVLLACGLDPKIAKNSLRISLSIFNTRNDIDDFIDALKQICQLIKNTEHNL